MRFQCTSVLDLIFDFYVCLSKAGLPTCHIDGSGISLTGECFSGPSYEMTCLCTRGRGGDFFTPANIFSLPPEFPKLNIISAVKMLQVLCSRICCQSFQIPEATLDTRVYKFLMSSSSYLPHIIIPVQNPDSCCCIFIHCSDSYVFRV